ncbi:MAG: M13 family metallopeptidase [Chthoniobacterales bacterium]
MFKSLTLVVASLFWAMALSAQTTAAPEPVAGASAPPYVNKGSRPPTDDKIPPPISTPKTKAGDKTAMKDATTKKNPPAFDVANMDKSVKPSDDFYTYANGTWLKKNPIPPEESRWGSFSLLLERNNMALKEVAEKAAKTKEDPKLAPDVQKVGDYYASGMDEKAIDDAKAKPLAEELKNIDAIKDNEGLLKEIAHLHLMGVNAFFGFTSGQDDKNSTMVIAQAYQGGLGMPDRDYYTKDDDASKKLREAYVAHVTKMLTLIGDKPDQAKAGAEKVMALETSLAKPARTRVELRDPQKNYNKMSVPDLQALMPNWNWLVYFRAINLTDPGEINVGQPDFFKAANEVLKTTSLDDWKTYLRWHLVKDAAPQLSSDFVNENFKFFGTTLTGAKQLKPRWKRVIASTDGAIGEALGQLYVADNFPPESKQRMIELVKNIREAMADSIKTRDWMDDATKQEALKKLAAMNVKIGYPDKWRDYSTLKIDRGPYVLNAMRAAEFETDRELKKIGKPVDRGEWGMTPPTVNAYYNPNMNEIVFPAGILQPPFFNANGDDAINYGGIGAVIAHEITHGFDDQGRQYDATGNLRDWWTPESAAKYKERADKIVAQYSAYEPLPGLHINGQLTEGENLADDGGVKLTFAALQKALAGKEPPKIDGFTPEQRFFLGWAQVWRANIRDEALKLRLNTDPHSPTKFCCNGPLSNSPDFKKAFNLPDDCKMVRPADQIVSIW